MRYLKSYPIYEKSIGIENIYQQYYSDIPRNIFDQLLELDPTTPYSTESHTTDKLGKYSKWILREYRKGYFDSYVKNNEIKKLKFLKEELALLTTNWLRKKLNKNIDILTYSYPELTNLLGNLIKQYHKDTATKKGQIKYDLLYEDDNWTIFVPLNASTAMYLSGKETQWCSNVEHGYNMWKQTGMVFYRFIPKLTNYKKMRLTWNKDDLKYNWAFAYTYSPVHLYGKGKNPFDNHVKPEHEIQTEINTQILSIPYEAIKEVINYHKQC